MDPLNWILITWLAVAGFIFFIVQKVIEFWPVDPSTSSIGDSNQQNLQQHQQSYSNSSTLDVKHLKSGTGATSFFGFSPSHQQQQQQQQQQYHSYQTKSVESVDWMNDFLAWLFQHYKGSPDFLNSWLKSMNDAAKKIAPLVGCEVLFEEISTEDRRAPQLSNIRTEQGPREHLTLRGRFYSPSFSLRLVTSQKLPDRLIVTNYDAKLTNLTGDAQIRAACIGNELFLMACFDGRPDVTIHLENKDLHGVEQVDHSCVQEAIRKSLMSSVTNLSIRGNHGQSTESVEDVFRRLNASSGVVVTGQPDRIKSNRLLVKILKAEKLEGTEIPQQPYVVIEIDEPPQKHTTTLGLNACPVWDEHFLFDVNRRSEELLFEVYDKRKPDDENPQFVGLAIVGLEELRQSAITSHALKLQPRPYTNERVQGVLFVECMFLYEMGAGKETEIIRDELDHGIITQTTTTTKRPLVAISSDVKDGDRTVVNVTPTKTSSVIVKSVSQYIHGPAESTDHIAAQESTTKTTASTNATRKSSKEIVKPALKQISAPSTPKSTASRVSATPGNERGRKPERPSFFSDLKQKLSFKGKKPTRAQSLDQGQGLSPTDVTYHPPRSISQPPSRDQSATRHPELGAAGSDSELSVTSNDSIYHQSSLVVETIENSVKKYHLIPTSLIRHPNAKKLMKLGRKLHIYNEHTFVAVKVPSSTTCKVCLKAVTGAFRRQGYQCRDCRMVCHKKCHFKTEIRCPNSKVSTLQMEYFWTNS